MLSKWVTFILVPGVAPRASCMLDKHMARAVPGFKLVSRRYLVSFN